MQTRVLWGFEFLRPSLSGSVLLVLVSACSGAPRVSPGTNAFTDAGNPSRESGAGASAPSGSGASTGSGGRATGSGGASAGHAGSTSRGGARSAGGNTSAGVTTGSAGTSGAGGDTSPCAADLRTVSNDFEMAVSVADVSCTNDGECVEGPTSACDSYCTPPIVSKKGAGRLQASIDATAAACARVQMQGCSNPPTPCTFSLGTPACVNGMCERFLPVAWSSVTFAEAPNSSVNADCAHAGACEEWTVYPDGRVTNASPGVAPRTAMLTPPDIERVTTIVESVAFRQGVLAAFPCTAPASPHTPIMLMREDPSGKSYGHFAEDCIYGGPANNDERALWLIVHDALAADAGP